MPNHVTNTLTSNNLPAVKALLVNDKGKVDFNLLVPMPEGMQDIVDGSGLMALSALMGKPSNPFTGSSPEELIERCRRLHPDDFTNFGKALALYNETGFWSWYDWSCDQWGTKWNAYEHDVGDEAIVFLTAWSPPEPIMQALRAKLPADVTLSLEWEDEGGPNGVISL